MGASAQQTGLGAPEGAEPSGLGATPAIPRAARCITIRDGFYWAHIFDRCGAETLEDGWYRHWAHIAILSDFGTYGYCWSHMGKPWERFAPELSFDYAMGKLAGRHFLERMDTYECCEKTRQIVIERRRSGCMSKKDARSLWDALPYCDGGEAFLADLDRHSDGAMYSNELWDYRWERPSAQAQGFWKHIWPLYLDALAAATGTAKTPTAAEGEASQSGPKGNAHTPTPSSGPQQ